MFFPFRRPYRLRSVYERLLGTEVEIQVVAGTRLQAEAAERRALAEIARLTQIFNRFDPHSELSRWQQQPDQPARLSHELYEVLALADHWRILSSGAFHPGADALGALWKAAAQSNQRPDPQQLAQNVQELQTDPWTLHPDDTATLHARYALGLNALAKGYIVDRAAQAIATAPGVRAGLVNAGGDLQTSGPLGVEVAIASPWSARDDLPSVARIRVQDGALATSGSAHRGYQVGEQWFSHVLDPRTGEPVQHIPGISVTAPDCATADALATVLGVLPLPEALALVETLPGAAALIISQDGQSHASSRWLGKAV